MQRTSFTLGGLSRYDSDSDSDVSKLAIRKGERHACVGLCRK